MKSLLITVLVIIATSTSFAQDTGLERQWSNHFGGQGTQFGVSIVSTGDGGCLMAGGVVNNPSNYELLLVRTDEVGEVIWSDTLGGDNQEYYPFIIRTSDGGYAIAAFTNSFGAGGFDLWLIKLDGDCDVEWSQTYGDEGNDGLVGYLPNMAEMSDGGFILGGLKDNADGDDMGIDAYLVRTDPAGEIVWERTYGTEDNWDYLSWLHPLDNGGILCAGGTTSGESNGRDCWLLELDSEGETVREQIYQFDGDQGIQAGVSVEDSWVFACLDLEDWDAWELTDARLMRIDADWEIDWSETYGGDDDDWVRCIDLSRDEYLIVCGYTNSFARGVCDGWLLAVDPSDGDSLWSHSEGGFGDDWFNNMCCSEDGDFFVTGVYENRIGQSSNYDAWVLHYDGTLPVVETDRTRPDDFDLLRAYPNPFNSSTLISFRIPLKTEINLSIFNMAGVKVSELINGEVEAGSHRLLWEAAEFPTGQYLVRLENQGRVVTEKVMLIK